MNNIDSEIIKLYDSGFFCAESVLVAIAERQGIESELIPRIATGLCAGFSRTSGMCGALTGAILALNMVYGRDLPNESKEKNYEVVEKMIRMFEEQVGSTNCTKLCGCDLSTKEGQIAFHDENLIAKCKEYSIIATKIAVQLLEATKEI